MIIYNNVLFTENYIWVSTQTWYNIHLKLFIMQLDIHIYFKQIKYVTCQMWKCHFILWVFKDSIKGILNAIFNNIVV